MRNIRLIGNICDLWFSTVGFQHFAVSKWDIFHYTYGILHHPDYREKYHANLKRDLPHIPFAPDFLKFEGIPAKTYDYRLGTRSALEWIVISIV